MPQCKCTFTGLWGTKEQIKWPVGLFLTLNTNDILQNIVENFAVRFESLIILSHERLLKQGINTCFCYVSKTFLKEWKNSAYMYNGSSLGLRTGALPRPKEQPLLHAVVPDSVKDDSCSFAYLYKEKNTYLKCNKIIKMLI